MRLGLSEPLPHGVGVLEGVPELPNKHFTRDNSGGLCLFVGNLGSPLSCIPGLLDRLTGANLPRVPFPH